MLITLLDEAQADLDAAVEAHTSLGIQVAQAKALLVIAAELRKLNDSLGSIDLNILRIEGAMPK